MSVRASRAESPDPAARADYVLHRDFFEGVAPLETAETPFQPLFGPLTPTPNKTMAEGVAQHAGVQYKAM
jgi:hypothetical protein